MQNKFKAPRQSQPPKKSVGFINPETQAKHEVVDLSEQATQEIPQSEDLSFSSSDDVEAFQERIEEQFKEECRAWLNEFGSKQFQLSVNQWLVKREKKKEKLLPHLGTPSKKRKLSNFEE